MIYLFYRLFSGCRGWYLGIRVYKGVVKAQGLGFQGLGCSWGAWFRVQKGVSENRKP